MANDDRRTRRLDPAGTCQRCGIAYIIDRDGEPTHVEDESYGRVCEAVVVVTGDRITWPGPGPEADAIVAEKVMEYRVNPTGKCPNCGDHHRIEIVDCNGVCHGTYKADAFGGDESKAIRVSAESYSRDIAAAWRIIERLWDDKHRLHLERFYDGWFAAFRKQGRVWEAYEDEPANAICIAALRAKGYEVVT